IPLIVVYISNVLTYLKCFIILVFVCTISKTLFLKSYLGFGFPSILGLISESEFISPYRLAEVSLLYNDQTMQLIVSYSLFCIHHSNHRYEKLQDNRRDSFLCPGYEVH